METSVLLKRANYIRHEVLIDGNVAAHMDMLITSIKNIQARINRLVNPGSIVTPKTTDLNRMLIRNAESKLEIVFDKLNNMVSEIIKDRPVLREKVCAIM